MHRPRLRTSVLLGLAAVGMLVPLLITSPTSAAPPSGPPGCKATTTAGALIGHYPAWQGSQSSLFVACVFSSQTPGTDDTSSKFTIHDFKNAIYHQGGARLVHVTAAGTTTTFTIGNCTGMTTAPNEWKNRGISKIPELASTGVFAQRTAVKSVSGACLVTLNKAMTTAAIVGDTFRIENSNGRQVGDATFVGNVVCSTEANFDATVQPSTHSDIGLSVSGTQIPTPGAIPTITAVGVGAPCAPGVSNATFSGPASIVCPGGVPATNCQVVSIGGSLDNQSAIANSTTRTVNDATYTDATHISSAAAKFKISDIGCQIRGNGAGYTALGTGGPYVTAVAGAVATISATNGASVGTHIVTICEPSATASGNPAGPTNETDDAEGVLSQGVQLDLSPTLVAGSGPCADDTPEGFTITGTWYNPEDPALHGTAVAGDPDAFHWLSTTGFFSPMPAGTKAIAQLQFKTAAITYGAYIIERPVTAAPDPTMPFVEPIGPSHYDIVFGNVPTALALCVSATSPGLGFMVTAHATTPLVAALPTGSGRPGTAQVRATRGENCSVACLSTGYVRSDDTLGPTTWVGTEFERICVYTDPVTVGFKCGP